MEVVDAARVARERDVRECSEEVTRLAHDAEVRAESNAAAAARRCAVDHGDDGLRALLECERGFAGEHGELVTDELERRHFVDVAAGREVLARARDDDDLDRIVRVAVFDGRNEVAEHLRVEGIVCLLAVNGDRCDAVLDGELDMFVHESLLFGTALFKNL